MGQHSGESSEGGRVTCEVREGVAYVTFGHPRGNSLPGALLRSIAGNLDQVGGDQDVRVVVLQSEGEKVFCGGASFDELLSVRTIEESREFFSGFAILIGAMRRSPKFIVTRVQGKVVGGGVGVVAASDYALAHEGASLRLSELALGFGPFVIGPAVQRKIGHADFAAMAIDTEWRDAGWALSRGLYAHTYRSHEELDAGVAALALRLAAFNPDAMAALKRVLWEGTEHWEQLLPARVEITSALAITEFVQSTVSSLGRR